MRYSNNPIVDMELCEISRNGGYYDRSMGWVPAWDDFEGELEAGFADADRDWDDSFVEGGFNGRADD